MQWNYNINPFRKRFLFSVFFLFFLFSPLPCFSLDGDYCGKLIDFQGTVDISHTKNSSWQTVSFEMLIYETDTIRTGNSSRAAILMKDNSLIKLHANSLMRFAKINATKTKQVSSVYQAVKGKFWFQSTRKIDLETPACSLSIRGTEFVLEIDNDAQSLVSMIDGQSEMQNPLGSIVLKRGEQGYCRKGEKPQKRILINPENAVQWSLFYPISHQLDEIDPLDPAKLLIQKAINDLSCGMVTDAQQSIEQIFTLKSNYQYLAYGLLSNIYLVLNQREKALTLAQQAISLNPSSSSAWVDLAWAQQSLFNLDAATESAKKAIELNKTNIRALITYSQLLFGSGNINEAEQFVQNALIINPNESLALTLQGFILLAKNQTDQAIKLFELAISHDRTFSQPYLGLGIAYMRQGKIDKGLEYMHTATLLEPNYAMNFTYLGKALYQSGDHVIAEKILSKAKQIDPLDPSPYLYLGIMYMDANRSALAIKEIEKAVELNNHRAVYRSRFLLDQDRAVKNIDLAKIYASLGMNAMAKNRAMISLKDDPSNSSAHLLMATSLLEEGDRSEAAYTELLKCFLLQPVNQNSFNSFNEYTSFFEKPDLGLNVNLQAANYRSFDYTTTLFGNWNSVAAQQLLRYSSTQGYKENNFSWYRNNITYVKYQPSIDHDIFFSYKHVSGRSGDTINDTNAYSENDLDYTDYTQNNILGIGYHYKLSPKSDLLISIQAQLTDSYIEDGIRSEKPYLIDYPELDAVFDVWPSYSKSTWDDSFYNISVTHQHAFSEHIWVYGGEFFVGENYYTDHYINEWVYEHELIDTIEKREDLSITPQHATLYVYDTWRINSKFIAEGGLFYEKTQNANIPLSEKEYTIERVHPRMGLTYTPDRFNTFRTGFYRYLQCITLIPERLQPIDVAGFVVGQNAWESALHQEISFAWDRQLNSSTFLSTTLFARERQERWHDTFEEVFLNKKRQFYGINTEINHMFLEYFAIQGVYEFVRNAEDTYEHTVMPNSERFRDDQQFDLRVMFVHPTGWKASIKNSFIQQRLHDTEDFGMDSPNAFWLSNVSLQKEMWQKTATVGLWIDNLFDKKFHLITNLFQNEVPLPARKIYASIQYRF
ncbi:MAG: FecR domain-containing protein [Desulfobacterales bacterium]|nr:FecR domain-containing protein [Desulfobacterales bacterium]